MISYIIYCIYYKREDGRHHRTQTVEFGGQGIVQPYENTIIDGLGEWRT